MSDRPERRPNRVPEYDYSGYGAYFVTICTQDRKQILSQIVGDGFPVPKPCGKICEHFICKIPEKYPNVTVDNYVIMPDHIHMLLRFHTVRDGEPVPYEDTVKIPSPTLGNVIGWFKYQVTKQINCIANTSGERIFQRSYYDHVIRNQQDYNEVWEYIAYNPQKWVSIKEGRE